MKLLSLFFTVLLLVGCAPIPNTRSGAIPETGAGPDATQAASNPAVTGLLAQASQQFEGGHNDAAAASIERALRIAPGNVAAYQALALVRLAQNDTWQAEALALKANSLAVGHPNEQAENWSIIAAARRQRGDMMGADAAARAAAVLQVDVN